MNIRVKVNLFSKQSFVEQKGEDKFEVSVKSKPEGGKANREVLNLLSDFLEIDEKRLKIIKGSREKSKIIKII